MSWWQKSPWLIAATVVAACGSGSENLSEQSLREQTRPASATQTVPASQAANAATLSPQGTTINPTQVQQAATPTVNLDPRACARRADGPPYSCLTCTVGGLCDTGVVCRRGVTTACIADRPICADAGPEMNGTTCGAMGAGMVCTGGMCGCPPGQSSCGGICRPTGAACSAGVGGCARAGVIACNGVGSTACNAVAGAPSAEICNSIDDDCDGVIDDITPAPCQPSACTVGTTYCNAGALACARTGNVAVNTVCAPPASGICDGVGNCVCRAGTANCGGVCTPGVGNACVVGVGVCQRFGGLICSGAGTTTCSAAPGAPTEGAERTCNDGLDNDCDGLTDNADTDCNRPGDRCTNPFDIALAPPGFPTRFGGDTSPMVHDMDGNCGAANTAPDVFYRFTIPQRSIVYAHAYGSAYDIVLFFSSGCGAVQPGGYACNDDSCGTLQSQIYQVMDPGTYYLVVSGFAGSRGPYTIEMQTLPASLYVAQIPEGFSNVAGNTAGWPNLHTPTCGFSAASDHTYFATSCWWSPGGFYYAWGCGGTAYDSELQFRQGNSGITSCNDDWCGLQSYTDGFRAGGAGINAFYVDGWAGNAGFYNVWFWLP